MTEILKQTILEKRPYQNEALLVLSDFIKNVLRGTLEEDKKVLFKNSALLNMATGSGKTFTIGKALDNIFELRNRYNSIKNKEEFQKLNIVILTHRIDLVNQFRDDLVYGRDEKVPILSEDILDGLHISTYHSKADDSDKILETEEQDLGKKEIKDNIIFSTYQTAGSENLVEKLDYIDIILIDESHNVKKDSEYLRVIEELSKKTRKKGEEAIILPITATPNNNTKEIFGEEKFNYGLEKYLNSEYSPSVDYNLVTNSNASAEIVEKLQNLVEQAKNTQDFSEKKELIKEAEELFIKIMSSFNDDEELVDDIFERAGKEGKLGETVIFCESIEKADKLAKIISKKSDTKDFALSFHSANDSNKAIDRLRDKNDPCKVILSIGKLNEGIDLPKVQNVVFWRGTDSETIFFQQFGRGLRGNELVKYFDYVGGIKNFAWINGIFQKYNKIKEEEEEEENNRGGKSERKNKFSLFRGTMGTNEHNINFSDIGIDILNIKNEFNITKEEVIDYFKNIKGSEEESYEYWMNLKTNEISNIEIKGNKIHLIGNIFNFNDCKTPKNFKILLDILFDKKLTFNENVIKYLNGCEDLFLYSKIDIENIKINGKGIKYIGTKLGYDKNIRLENPKNFYEFINWLFDTNLRQNFIDDFKKKYKYEVLFLYKKQDINNFRYKDLSFIQISKKFGWNAEKYGRVDIVKNYKKFINYIYGIENKKEIGFLEIKEFFTKKGFEHYNSLVVNDIKKLDFQGMKIRKIVSSSGWINPNKVNVQLLKGFKEFIDWIFEKDETKN